MNKSKTPITSPSEPLAYGVEAAARKLGIGRTLLRELIRKGLLHPLKLGSRTLISRRELENLMADLEVRDGK